MPKIVLVFIQEIYNLVTDFVAISRKNVNIMEFTTSDNKSFASLWWNSTKTLYGVGVWIGLIADGFDGFVMSLFFGLVLAPLLGIALGYYLWRRNKKSSALIKEENFSINIDNRLENVRSNDASTNTQLSSMMPSHYYIDSSWLTEEIADDLMAESDGINDIYADEYKNITNGAAEVLAGNSADLFLNGICHLDEVTAKNLSTHEYELHLDGLSELSPEVAEALSLHTGSLALDGLTFISTHTAEKLAKYRGESLFLKGLREISDAVAEKLASYSGELFLFGLETLSAKAALSFTSISRKALFFGESFSLSAETARSFIGFQGQLNLLCSQLSHEVQCILAELDCAIYANGLTEITSPHFARKIVESIREKIPADRTGYNWHLTTLNEEIAIEIGRLDGTLWLKKLKNYTDRALIELIMAHADYGHTLYLGDVRECSEELAKAMTLHKGRLCVNIEHFLDTHWHKQLALKLVNESRETLYVHSTKSLGPGVAAVFAKFKGDIQLNSLGNVSQEVAEALATHSNGSLTLQSSVMQDDEAMKALSKHRGQLVWYEDHGHKPSSLNEWL